MSLRIGDILIPSVKVYSTSGTGGNYQNKTITPSTSSQVVTADSGYDALNQVTINAILTETKTVTTNGVVTPSSGKYLTQVTVNVPTGSLVNNEPSRTVVPTTSQQTITPASGYTGLSQVIVSAISPVKTSSNLIASGDTVTVPAGYYATDASATILSGSYGTMSKTTTKDSESFITSFSFPNFSAGYIAAAPSGQAVLTLESKTVTPSTSQQTITPTSTSYYLNSVVVNAIPSNYIIPSGSQTLTANNTYDVSSLAQVIVDVPTSGVSPHNLPSNYIELLSASNNASTRVDTGYGANMTVTSSTKIHMYIKFQCNTTSSNYLFQSRATSSGTIFGISGSGTGGTIIAGWNGNSTTSDIARTVGHTYEIDVVFQNGTTTLTVDDLTNGTHNVKTGSYSVGSPTTNFFLFGNAGGNYLATEGADINEAIIEVNDVQIFHYVPASTNNTVGFYNLVDDTFILPTNGSLIAGQAAPVQSVILQNKIVNPSESQQNITADSGYNGLGTVTVNAISSTYVGSGITRRTSTNLGLSNGVVSAPAGYYANAASFTIPTETATYTLNGTYTPSTNKFLSEVTVNVQPNNQNKTVSPTTSQQTVTADTGYTGLGTVTVNAIATETKSATPSTSQQIITPTSGKYLTQVTIAAIQTETKSATPSTTAQTITPSSGKYLTSVSISAIQTETKTATPNTTTQTITPSTGKYLTSVTVNPIPSGYIIPSGSQTITTNNTYDVTDLAEIVVNVPTGSTINNQNKTVTPTESSQSVSADTGYTGLGTVTVSAISSDYVGSNIDRRNSSSLTVSEGTVYVPAGYYANAASGTVANGYVPNPTLTIDTRNGTCIFSASVSVGAGYVTGGDYSSSQSVPTVAGITVTPTESEQLIADTGRYTLGQIKVAAISDTYVGSGIDTRDSTDLTVSGATVSVPAGYYSSTASASVATGSYGSGSATTTKDSTHLITRVTYPDFQAGYFSSAPSSQTALALEDKTVTPSTQQQVITPTNNSKYLNSVTVAAITASTLTNTIINGTAFEETTGDYGFRVTVNIPAGYHNAGTLTKEFSTILPAPQTEGTATQVLIGYDVYNHYGQLISGTMANNGTWNSTLDDSTISVTIPSGYHSGSGKVSHTTVAVPNPTFSFDASTRTVTASGSWTKGYTTNNSYSNTYTVAAGSLGNYSWSNSSNSTTLTLTATYPNFTAGYISSVSNVTRTFTLQSATITPSATQQVVTPTSGNHYINSVTVSGDANLVAGNIKNGVSIFGITGSYTGTNISNQNKTVTPSTSQQTVTYDSGYTGLGTVTIEAVPVATFDDATLNYSGRSGSFRIQWPLTTPGYVDTGLQTFINPDEITGDFSVISSDMLITPTESQQAIASYGTFVNANITVDAIPSNYIGSGITTRTSNDLTVNGATVTAPAGYYAAAASKSVAAMTLPTSTSTTSSGSSAMSAIGRSTSTRYINIPVGYNSTAKYYTISAVANGSVTAPSSISGTSASISAGTNTLTFTKTISVTPNVTTAGYISSGTAGNSSVSLTASVTTKGAATITPGTSNQTIASGTYLTGTQTISGDANLVGSNILSGVSIFGVAGTVSFVTYYTGSSTPSSSLGNNGDIYLQS